MPDSNLNKKIRALLKKGYSPKEVYEDMQHLVHKKNILTHAITKESKVKMKEYQVNLKI